MDVYRSKQNDTWAMILKSQLADENRKKLAEIEKHEADKSGIQLKEQLADNEIRRSAMIYRRIGGFGEETSKNR